MTLLYDAPSAAAGALAPAEWGVPVPELLLRGENVGGRPDARTH